jgi:hypothetical protein
MKVLSYIIVLHGALRVLKNTKQDYIHQRQELLHSLNKS